MATSERSYAWATGVAGTDGATTYDSSRFTAMQTKQNSGNGVLSGGSNFALSGSGTTILTIANGSGVIGGYFYETNGSVTISTTGLSGTYQIIIVANTAAGTQTVSANGAGTTTIAASTTRAAIVTSAQKTTIIASVGASNVVQLGSIVIGSGTISSYTLAPDFSYTPTYPIVQFAQLEGAPNTTVATSSATALQFNTATVNYPFMSGTAASGVITITGAKLVLLELVVAWDNNATGNRAVYVTSGGSYTYDSQFETVTAASLATIGGYKIQRYTQTVFLDTTYSYVAVSFTATAWQDSGTSRIANAWLFRATRLA